MCLQEFVLHECVPVLGVQIEDNLLLGIEQPERVVSVATLSRCHLVGVARARHQLPPRYIFIRLLLELLDSLNLDECQLGYVADAHHMAYSLSGPDSFLMARLKDHLCTDDCKTIFEFSCDEHSADHGLSAGGGVEQTVSDNVVEQHSNEFPFLLTYQFKFDMIREWQARMHPNVVSFFACAVCAQQCKFNEIEEVDL